jgi:outer membrane protein OmpA-like peptidoglycan-associated protein
MIGDYEQHVQDSDELGPGSDLVISMFALAMLVVALIGSGFVSQGEDTSAAKAVAALTAQISDLTAQRDAAQQARRDTEAAAQSKVAQLSLLHTLQNDLAERNQHIAEMQRELSATKAGLQAEIAAHSTSGDAQRITALEMQLRQQEVRAADMKLTLDLITTKASQAERDKHALEVDNSQLNAKVNTLEAQIEALKQAAMPTNSFLTLRDSAGTSYFPNGSAEISRDGRQLLLNTLRQKADLVRSRQLNTIVIEGYTSPDPRRSPDGVDTNEQLAFDRADAVAKILIDAGIPRRCVALMSYGRNRSELLYGPDGIKPYGTERDAAEFDRDYRSGALSLPDDKLAAERRIEIRAVSNLQYNLCRPWELSIRLAALR